MGGGSEKVPIAFYTDDWGASVVDRGVKVGDTVAILNALQHIFLDMTTGIWVEEDKVVTVGPAPLSLLMRPYCGLSDKSIERLLIPWPGNIIPMTLANLLALSDRDQRYSTLTTQGDININICHGCDAYKTVSSLRKCSRCGLFWYCDKVCPSNFSTCERRREVAC